MAMTLCELRVLTILLFRSKNARWDIARASQKPRVLMLYSICVCQDNVKGTLQQPAHCILIGNAESGALFECKTRFIGNLLENACLSFPGGVELFYLTTPYRIQPASLITRAGKRVTPEEGDFDAWTWAFRDYMTEVIQGYGQTIRYMLEVIQTVGPVATVRTLSIVYTRILN